MVYDITLILHLLIIFFTAAPTIPLIVIELELALHLRILEPDIANLHDFHLLLDVRGCLRCGVPRDQGLVHRLTVLLARLENQATTPTALNPLALIRRLITARHRLIELVHELAAWLGASALVAGLLTHIGGSFGKSSGHGSCRAAHHEHLILTTGEHAWRIEVVIPTRWLIR